MESKVKSSSLQKASRNKGDNKYNTQQKPNKPMNHKNTITLGICAMKKKVQSKPMKEILSRLRCPEIEILEMWQHLDTHWSTWPVVDALICFHSDGFPYLMAWHYVNKHKPFLINNLDKQQLMWDRTIVYDLLKKIKVPVAKHYFIFRDKNYIDAIQARGYGKIISDPQESPNTSDLDPSEKPLQKKKTGEDKNIRKIKSRSSMIDNLQVRSPDLKQSTNFKQSTHLHSVEEQEQNVRGKFSRYVELPKEQRMHHYIKKHRYSDLHQSQINNSSPTLLRNCHAKRNAKIVPYEVEEADDHIIIKSGEEVHKLKKPFVEKPFDAQNHQICIYYPQTMGGGRKKLFRKVKDCSSQYENNENSIRRDGNYIYQEYLPTNAFDIKVYTIGPYYMYAEARKSPTLDGVVQRNSEGKELRYPVLLTPDEKFICNRIVQEFQQEVCGFDLLRSNGKSYVCDVNGWSFVKGNPNYWEDCSTILKKKIFYHFFPGKIHQQPLFNKFLNHKQSLLKLPMDNLNPKIQELRSIVSIFRHGDRSPKLKLKIKTTDPRFLQFFNGSNKQELKFKDAKNLTKILQITNNIIAQLDHQNPLLKDYLQMKMVLEAGGHFEGFTRKLQLKVAERASKQEGQVVGAVMKVLIVLKWGGQLSYFGYQDAIQLGKKMRIQRYDDKDLLSLYSSYKHDVKTYSSDEGRCIKTAAAFLKGFLSIGGELAPIISSMVRADSKAQRLLDCTRTQNHSNFADELQVRLSEILNTDEQLIKTYSSYCGQSPIPDRLKEVILKIGKPRAMLSSLHRRIKDLVTEIERIYLDAWEQQGMSQRTSHHQSLDDEEKCQDIMLVNNRWSKLKKDIYDSKTQKFNISKIPQIYDTIRHDLRKNSLIFNHMQKDLKEDVLELSKTLAYFVVINEYGFTDEERIKVGTQICLPLLEKISIDLMFWKGKSSDESYWKYLDEEERHHERNIRTRLYFTSASHMYSLLNLIALGQNRYLSRKSPAEAEKVLNILYMGYLSHIQFRLYENLTMEEDDANRFRLEISFSTEYKKQKEMREFSLGGKGFTIKQINQFIKNFVSTQKISRSKSHRSQKEKKKD